MIGLHIDNKQGKLWDLSGIVSDITWKTSRIGKPASLEFTLVGDGLYQWKDFEVQNGYVVRFTYNGANLFYGYVFTISTGTDKQLKITAYDQVRYLLGNDTFVFTNVTADEVVRQIAVKNNLKVGKLDKGAYTIPSMLEDNKKLLDIIMGALDRTLAYKTQLLVFYDDFGQLRLQNILQTEPVTILGKGHFLYDYSIKKSIDSETYNQIKFYRDNKETGHRDIFIRKDSNNIGAWGLLQKYEKAEDDWNEAQLQEAIDRRLALYNREQVTLSVDAIGDVKVRAGRFAYILLDEFDTQVYLIEECSHKFTGTDHTMSLDVKVV
ncbi:XkdQ/YqbQ family protein [Paenibacillus wenxiniae]|uniref:YqbQ/XkdQ domain-containing protein n=1 Tax=Paenibacillus wenxiniae TaxID=1636843 RepID=A0ABW4RJB8_9BACL